MSRVEIGHRYACKNTGIGNEEKKQRKPNRPDWQDVRALGLGRKRNLR